MDRIDSSKGYVFGNVQWVHKRVNDMKVPLSDNEFRQLCSVVIEHGLTLKRPVEMGLSA